MPCLIVGCGGHSPLEKLFEACDGTPPPKKAPTKSFPAVPPRSFQFPKGDSANVKYFNDDLTGGNFGYLKVTVDAKARILTFEFMGVKDGKAVSLDSHTISI
jgi:hypothetical protein